ncbi:hypothetical protein X740_04465 [Mesorhizobium sp. LNHC221B00]|uniref:hypothetical protein n=1 Tax=Mesorhizobium sp. LNHC221B00 TaxID=1287233 RepID=UPI0003CE15B7|nr:hypothetical protein [Mesorhizobium sp. LNHC221B00]ESY82455.1 hypothetical protein X740_04465 [Mesorhizobium sp. LNHC221B00]
MTTRLIAALCVVIAFLALGLTAYHYKLSARDAIVAQQAAERSLKTALDVNADNEKTMTAQAKAQARADQLAADLAAEIDVANQSALAVARTLAELRAKNADVDAYLKAPVPGALRGLYADKPAGPH